MSDDDRARAELVADLEGASERLATDEQLAGELYRALAGGRLTKDGASVAPSWGRAEATVNGLLERHGREPLALAQTGGEGELSDGAARLLEELGWRWKPRDTSRHDPAHSGQDESPPPGDAGERHAPVSDSHEWERQAHEEAEASRLGRADAPAEALPGTGAGGGEAPRVGGG
jgi:hypothetical protein